MTIRNPFSLTGYDVRGILFTDDTGHLLMNPDDWTKLWDVPGGQTLNPFKGFYGFLGQGDFGPGVERIETYEVYIPLPPQYNTISFAVDASYPGNCKDYEPIEKGESKMKYWVGALIITLLFWWGIIEFAFWLVDHPAHLEGLILYIVVYFILISFCLAVYCIIIHLGKLIRRD